MSGPTEAAGQHASQQQQQTSYLHPSAADSKQQASKRHQLSGSSAVEGLRAAMQLAHAQKQGDRNVKLRVKKLDKKTKARAAIPLVCNSRLLGMLLSALCTRLNLQPHARGHCAILQSAGLL